METYRRRRSSALVAALLGLAVIFPSSAAATSYWSTVSFTVAVNGAVRPYVGTNMKIQLTSHETINTAINVYWISLYRHSCFLFICNDDFIGKVQVPRAGGSGVKTWTNVGSGDYWFRFEKANDGVRVWSDDVHMWST